MARARFNELIEPMTLGNMRANGVRSLDVSCWNCHHRAILRSHDAGLTQAGSKGELLDTAALRGQIARFLRKHADGHTKIGRSSVH
jgi:hypothetical protein